MRFPATCPECALESLSEMPVAVIANALLTGKGIRLYASCHDIYWTATFVEREQLRHTLRAIAVDARQDRKEPQSPSDSRDATRPSQCV